MWEYALMKSFTISINFIGNSANPSARIGTSSSAFPTNSNELDVNVDEDDDDDDEKNERKIIWICCTWAVHGVARSFVYFLFT